MSGVEPAGLRETLAETMGRAPWSMLTAHVERDGLVFVDPTLDLLDVAVALARDDEQSVTGWMTDGLLTKPTPEDIARHAADTEKRWTFAIVQPFVLVVGRTSPTAQA